MKNLITLIIIFLVLILIITGLSVYIVRLKAENQPLIDQNQRLKEQLLKVTFSDGTKAITIIDRNAEIETLNSEIADWEIEQLSVTEMIDILEYCILYIRVCQLRMANAGIDYPVWVVDGALKDILNEREVTE